MDLVVRAAHGEAEVTLVAAPTDATLGDLVRQATGTAPPRVCIVDGRPVTAVTPLHDVALWVGSTISTDGGVAESAADAVVELVQVAGRGAGSRLALAPGRYLVGPGTRTSAAELGLGVVDDVRFELDVATDGTALVRARAGTIRLDGAAVRDVATAWTGEILDTGQRAFRLVAPSAAAPTRAPSRDGSATLTFNRPPRAAPLAPWQPPEPTPGASARRVDRAAVERFAAAVATGRVAELDRLRRTHPDPVTLAGIVRRLDPELWGRRPSDADAFRFAVGLADRPWTTGSPADDALPTLAMVPVVADLADHTAVGVVGSPGSARAVIRSLLLEAAVAHGPADLGVVVLTSADRAPSWEWTKWLPHARTDGPPAIVTTRDDVEDWAARIGSDLRTGAIDLVVVDEPAWWRERTSPLRPLLADASLPLRWVVAAAAVTDLPAACATIVTADADGTASVESLGGGGRVDGLIAFHTSADDAMETARRLAPIDDPDRPDPGESPLPERVGIERLVGAADPALVLQRWSDQRADVRIALGVGAHGIVEADLVVDGPHVVLAARDRDELGELLQAALVSIAAGTAPTDLALALVTDGPTVFGPVAELPHVTGVVSAPDRLGVERVVRSLRAELARRADVSDPAGSGRSPRLVVAIADIAAMAALDPAFASAIVDIASQGPTVGMHLVLATAAPEDAAPFAPVDGMWAARRLRAAASLDAVGMGAARHLPVHPPGRALVRTGDGTITLVQTVSLDRLDPEHLDGLVIRPFVVARERSAMEHRIERAAAQADRSGASTPLGPIVAAMTTAAATVAVQPHRPPVVDRLPERLPLRAFFDAAPGDGVPYGLADLPDAQRREIAWWRPGVDGHLLVYGAAGTGATSLLTTLALGIAERYAPDDVHLYLLDADPAHDTARLAALAALPHCGGHVHVGEIRRVAALLAVLDAELDRRAVSPPDPSGAVVVLMVDDLAALRRAAGTRRDLDGMWPRIERILHEGAALGVVAVLTTSDARAVGGTAAVVPTRLVMRLDDAGRSTADQRADADLGVDPGRVAGFGRGRALRLGDDTEVQLVRPPDDVATAISALGLEPARDRPPRAIDEIVARDGEG